MSLRSPIGRVLGLGAAKEGVSHWWSQRVTSVALLLLGLWFVVSLLRMPTFELRVRRCVDRDAAQRGAARCCSSARSSITRSSACRSSSRTTCIITA